MRLILSFVSLCCIMQCSGEIINGKVHISEMEYKSLASRKDIFTNKEYGRKSFFYMKSYPLMKSFYPYADSLTNSGENEIQIQKCLASWKKHIHESKIQLGESLQYATFYAKLENKVEVAQYFYKVHKKLIALSQSSNPEIVRDSLYVLQSLAPSLPKKGVIDYKDYLESSVAHVRLWNSMIKGEKLTIEEACGVATARPQ